MRKVALLGAVGAMAIAGVGIAAVKGAGPLAPLASSVVQLPATGTQSASGTLSVNPTPIAADSSVTGDVIANAWICSFRSGTVPRGGEAAAASKAASAAGGQVGFVYSRALQGFSLNASAQGLAQMRARNPNIAQCEADRIARIIDPVDALAKAGGTGTTQPAEVKPWGITRVNGGISGATGTAWVIDTGIDLSHPDLNVDKTRSANFVPREKSPQDLNGHGTHVAGTIAAIDNTIGVIGVAAGAKVVAVRVLNRSGSGAYSTVIAGVDYVAQNGKAGDVANMSLGGPVSDLLDQAVRNASTNVKFTLAAGNESKDANLSSPARVNGLNVFTISASDSNNVLASFSNFGNPPVDYAQPGVTILSTWLSGGYNTISGTSMAAPHMAGLLLLGAPRDGGTVTGDRDATPDVIAVH